MIKGAARSVFWFVFELLSLFPTNKYVWTIAIRKNSLIVLVPSLVVVDLQQKSIMTS